MNKLSEQGVGAALVIAASVLWGTAGTFAKFLFNGQLSPYDLVQARATLSFLILAAYLFFTHRELLRIQRNEMGFFLIFTLFGLGLNQFTYMLAISQTNVATAIFLQYLAPALVLLYGILTRTEQVTWGKLTALIAATLGGYFIVRGTAAGLGLNPLGFAAGLAAALSYAFYNIYAKKGLDNYHSWTILAGAMGISALAWCFYQPPWVLLSRYHGVAWLQFLYVALMATIIPFGLYFNGLKRLSPFKAGLISTTEPVIAAITAFLFLGEWLNSLQILGCALVFAGVILIQTTGKANLES